MFWGQQWQKQLLNQDKGRVAPGSEEAETSSLGSFPSTVPEGLAESPLL